MFCDSLETCARVVYLVGFIQAECKKMISICISNIRLSVVCLIAIAHMIFKHMKDIKINAHLYYEPTEVYREKKEEKVNHL